MTYLGLSHLALVTNDMDATVRFYRDVLEMPLVATLSIPDRHYFFSIGPGAAIAFFEWKNAELPPRKDAGVPASGIQFDHVSVRVESDADLDRISKRLADVGADLSDLVDHGALRSIYCTTRTGSRWSSRSRCAISWRIRCSQDPDGPGRARALPIVQLQHRWPR